MKHRRPFGRLASRWVWVIGLAGLTAIGCRKAAEESAAPEDAGGKSSSSPGVIDYMTGKTAVDAGQRAKAVIKETSQERQEQLNEALDE